jgi:hypothetical protein
MTSTTEHLQAMWAAALEQDVPNTESGSDWLASLRVVMAALERTLQHEGRGAFVLLITPFGGLPPQPAEAAAPDPPQKGRTNPPAG